MEREARGHSMEESGGITIIEKDRGQSGDKKGNYKVREMDESKKTVVTPPFDAYCVGRQRQFLFILFILILLFIFFVKSFFFYALFFCMLVFFIFTYLVVWYGIRIQFIYYE